MTAYPYLSPDEPAEQSPTVRARRFPATSGAGTHGSEPPGTPKAPGSGPGTPRTGSGGTGSACSSGAAPGARSAAPVPENAAPATDAVPAVPVPPVFDAVVLAGGAAERLGRADKPGVRVGGRTLLDRVLAACADAAVTVVVGARRPTARPVVWAREEPPGGGPLAALHAGLRHTTADRVVVLSADLPFLDANAVHRLLTVLDGGEQPAFSRPEGTGPAGGAGVTAGPVPNTAATKADTSRQDGGSGGDQGGGANREGVVFVDRTGRDQPLAAAYWSEPLRREIALLAAEYDRLTGLPLRLLSEELTLSRVFDPVASFDCDTWDAIATARSRIREHEHVLDEWIAAVKDELGLDPRLDVDTKGLLDLTRDVAHGVTRPAGPLTTFLVGYAAAQQGGGAEAVAEAARKVSALTARWADEDQPGTDGSGSDGSGVTPDAG